MNYHHGQQLCHSLCVIVFWPKASPHLCVYFVLIFPELTFSTSSFLTDLRLARRSKETLCLEPSSERRIASAETLTLLRLGLLNFPRRSSTLMFRSLIWGESREKGRHLTQEVTATLYLFAHMVLVGLHQWAVTALRCVSLSLDVVCLQLPLCCCAGLWLQYHTAPRPPHLFWHAALDIMSVWKVKWMVC